MSAPRRPRVLIADDHALIDIPDFGTPLRSIAGSVERIADASPESPDAQTEPLTEASPRGNATSESGARQAVGRS